MVPSMRVFKTKKLINAKSTSTAIVKKTQLPLTNPHCPDKVAYKNAPLLGDLMRESTASIKGSKVEALADMNNYRNPKVELNNKLGVHN